MAEQERVSRDDFEKPEGPHPDYERHHVYPSKEEEYLRKIGLVLLDIRDMLEKQPVSDVADGSKEKLSFLMNRRV